MDEAIWSLAGGDNLLAERTMVVLGGTHTGRSRLLRIAQRKAALDVGNGRRLPMLCAAPPYKRSEREIELRVAAELINSISFAARVAPQGHTLGVAESLAQTLHTRGMPAKMSGLLDEASLAGGRDASLPRIDASDPLLWAFEVTKSVADESGLVPYILVDDVDRLPSSMLTRVFETTTEHSYTLAVTARSLAMTEYETPNLFDPYVQQASCLCLDFHPDDPEYRSACLGMLRRQAQCSPNDPAGALAYHLLARQEHFLEVALGLSCGQIGRFADFLRFVVDLYGKTLRFRVPPRTQLQTFCRMAFDEIVQKEPSEPAARGLRTIVMNLDRLADRVIGDLCTTWMCLSWGDDSGATAIDRSLARCSVLNWVFHAPLQERIRVAIDATFVPTKVKVSPMAAILGGVPLAKIWQPV